MWYVVKCSKSPFSANRPGDLPLSLELPVEGLQLLLQPEKLAFALAEQDSVV